MSRFNFRKSYLWLALTGWLPWRCYFGRHQVKIVGRWHVPRTKAELAVMHPMANAWYANGGWEYSYPCCKRCGRLL